MRSADLAIVGGGVVGSAVAFRAAREGLSVALLERDRVAAHASGAAAGMLLPMAEAAGPGPLLSWGQRSLALFPELVRELRERTGIDPGFEISGALHLAETPERAGVLRARRAALAGCDLEWLDGPGLRSAQPGLAESLCGALWSPREAQVNGARLARALARAAVQCGARVETGLEVQGLVERSGRVVGVQTRQGVLSAGAVALCAGAWTPGAARGPARRALPIEPVRGQILALEAPRPALRAIALAGPLYLVPRDGRVLVGATEERVGFDCRVTAAGLAGLLSGAARLLPALGPTAFHSAWAGLRPATPDGLPIVGLHPDAPSLWLAAGHSRNGVLLAPITAQLLVDCIAGKGLPADAIAFSPDRF